MKAAINGTMSDRRLLLSFIEAHEVREAKREEWTDPKSCVSFDTTFSALSLSEVIHRLFSQ
jgi:hypothetical protein